MAFTKYSDGEGFEVLRGNEANVLNRHFAKTGKRAVSDFSDEEKSSLQHDLDAAKAQNESEAD